MSSVDSPELTYTLGDGSTLELPETVNVTYNKTSIGTVAESVTWNEEDVAAVDLNKALTYTIHGTAALSQECTDGTTEVAVTLTVVVKEANLITDSDAAGFETSDGFTTSGDGITLPSTENVLDDSYAAHWWNGGDEAIASTISYDYGTLAAGYYTFELKGMGAVGDGVTLLIQNASGNTIATGETTTLTGWYADAAYWADATVTFHVTEATEINLVVRLDMLSGGWGSVDSMYLHQHANVTVQENGDETHSVTCTDCETLLFAAEPCESNPDTEENPGDTPSDNPNAGTDDKTNDDTTTTVKVGTKATVGKITYKVTKIGTSSGTVAVTGVKASATKVTIPATVKIKGVTYKVTSIANKAFKNNKKLTKVVIGKNIKTIGKKAFYGCKRLKTIVIKTKKLTKKSVGAKAFKGINAKAKIKVPKSKLKKYKTILRARGVSKKATIKASK